MSLTAARRRALSAQLSVAWAGCYAVGYHAAPCGEFGNYWCYLSSPGASRGTPKSQCLFSDMRLGYLQGGKN